MSWAPDAVVGCIDGKPLYVIVVSSGAMRRARELSAAGAAPTWFESGAAVGSVRIQTVNPDWFVELERAVAATTYR